MSVENYVGYPQFIGVVLFMFSAILGVYIIIWRITKNIKEDYKESIDNIVNAMSRIESQTVKEKFCDERHGSLESSFNSHCITVSRQFDTMRKEIREDLKTIFRKLDELSKRRVGS